MAVVVPCMESPGPARAGASRRGFSVNPAVETTGNPRYPDRERIRLDPAPPAPANARSCGCASRKDNKTPSTAPLAGPAPGAAERDETLSTQPSDGAGTEPMRSERPRCWLFAAIALAWTTSEPAAAAPPDVDFNRDIRPILSESCYQCHGPDANKRKADLRLDTRDGLFRSAEGSTVVVPGKPDESEFWLRIASDDPESRMPPPKAGKPMTPAQVTLVRRWIEQG